MVLEFKHLLGGAGAFEAVLVSMDEVTFKGATFTKLPLLAQIIWISDLPDSPDIEDEDDNPPPPAACYCESKL